MKKRLTFKNIIIISLVAYSIFSVVSQQLKIKNIKKEIVKQQDQLEVLKEKNQKLQDEVELSKSDLYIEKMARERLGYIKKQETPVIDSAKK
ncbi:FtsB family cell division protein [Clostridium hydrogeniformans]|uniref:FtsB family cell division protein n=1 Tax=Clostridium hydrogeniformans TaxID=349933 RepID=UPI0004857C70|nr:septum formation initiator family protein [Clostridium hydrogeniformans]